MIVESLDLDGGLIDFQCSIIQRASDTATAAISFRDALTGIQSGRWKAKVEAVRKAYARGVTAPAIPKEIRSRMETPEEARARVIKEATDLPKKALPGILFSGTFTSRNADHLIQHSGLICADLDKLGDQVGAIKEQLCADPHTLAAFVSPTGSGLKVVFRCDPAKPHEDAFEALQHYVMETFGLQIDVKCADVSRICFVSHDPEAFIAEDATLLPPAPPAPPPKEFKPKPVHVPGGEISTIDDYNLRAGPGIPALLESHGWKPAHRNYWTRPGKDHGPSASWGFYENTLIVFSDAPETGFPPDQDGFDPFDIYAHLVHHGDKRAAAHDLYNQGYGTRKKSPQQERLDRLSPLPDVKVPLPSPDDPDEAAPFRITLASKPVEPTTRLFLAGKPIATPGNLVTLISKAKTGKTATIGGVVAAIIGAHFDRHDIDTLGFTAPHTKEALVLIDTEQSPYDAFTCHQRAFSRAGQQDDVDWFHHYALVGKPAKGLKAMLPGIMARAKAKHGAVFTLIIDGVADLVDSVNDEAECNTLITWLRAIAVEYDCPVICVIHSNEAKMSGDDGRGHLGKQLTRKAESNLLLKKTGEITVITSEKQRKAPITEADGVAFMWSDEAQRHVSCQPGDLPQRDKGGRPKGCTFEMLESIWPKTADKALTMPQLLKYAKDEEDVSESTLRRIIKEAVQTGQLTKISGPIGPQYYLTF